MARPRKRGLDYFPFDVDFFSDEKMVCIAGEFGAKGELVAVKLLCAVYRNGYFAEWNDAARYKLMRDMPGVSGELLSQIVSRLVFWGFFDQSLFDTAGVLTSRGIQQRYFEAVRRRQPIDSDLPFLLVNVGRNHINVDNNSVNVNINATKESKVKEIKEKETKEIPPSIPPPGDLTRQSAEGDGIDLDDFLNSLSEESITRQSKRLGIDRDHFLHVAAMVIDEWRDTDTVHASTSGATRHLFNHIRKKLSADPKLRTATTARQAEAVRVARQADRAARDEADRAYRASVEATGRNGFQQWCEARGLDPATTSAKDLIKLNHQPSTYLTNATIINPTTRPGSHDNDPRINGRGSERAGPQSLHRPSR